jgi:hypothetical protein
MALILLPWQLNKNERVKIVISCAQELQAGILENNPSGDILLGIPNSSLVYAAQFPIVHWHRTDRLDFVPQDREEKESGSSIVVLRPTLWYQNSYWRWNFNNPGFASFKGVQNAVP